MSEQPRSDDHIDPYDAGYTARVAGLDGTVNPYAFGTAEYAEWADGYTAASLDEEDGL